MCQQHQESAKHAVKALTVCYSLGSPLGDIILFMPSTFEKMETVFLQDTAITGHF